MSKSILLAGLAVVALSFFSDNAFAGRRCCRTRHNCCQATCNTCCNTCNTGCATGCSATNPGNNSYAPPPPVENAPNPATAQANGNYQSFSYEPQAPVANTAVVMPARQSTSSFDQFRGDRKARGLY